MGLVSLGWLNAVEAAEQAARPETLVSTQSMLQMLLGLVVVVIIIFGLSVLIKRFSLVPGSSNGIIRVVGSLALNSKDRLLLVQVGEEQILVSASPGRVGKIHDLKTPVDADILVSMQRAQGKSFNSLLNQVLQKPRQ